MTTTRRPLGLALIFAALALALGLATPHTTTYAAGPNVETVAPAAPVAVHTPASATDLSQQDVTNLCTLFRPYGTGYVIGAWKVNEYHVLCEVIYGWGSCYDYQALKDVVTGDWSGPYYIQRTKAPTAYCDY